MNQKRFIDFLVEAKKRTYAAGEDNTSVRPLFNGSKQLEYQDGNYVYRDIYFGSAFFAGQETVEYEQQPIWSMVYSGGIAILDVSREQIVSIYAFLRQALRLVPAAAPYRGPQHFENGQYTYKNAYHGTLERFYGEECIFVHGQKVYELRYSGGFIFV
ncbi:DUF5680 domain-containing protein [Thermaerobacillus caldiproteolyticus]|uniref:DUF5680 domain-containing protein n=1 Tax=Thermaerobacillus caldiproteolyticus TaxID=247480 RepID=UPI0018F1131F|nr:DUF5680 domain-containing protein [Anoxybacillus caldiproteolyticus]